MRRARPSRRWAALAAYTALVYAAIPFTGELGLAFLRTTVGQWVFGPGLVLIVVVGATGVLVWLQRRGAPRWAYALIGITGGAYLTTLHSLAVRPLERIHLPEYGVMAWLAWLAVRGHRTPAWLAYVAAVVITAALGLGEELIQHVVPGRFFDWQDVRLNALSGVLGLLVLAAMRSGEGGLLGSSAPRPEASSARSS